MWQEGSCVQCKSSSLTFLKAQVGRHNVTGATTASIGPGQWSAAVRQGDSIWVRIPGGQVEIYKQETDWGLGQDLLRESNKGQGDSHQANSQNLRWEQVRGPDTVWGLVNDVAGLWVGGSGILAKTDGQESLAKQGTFVRRQM